MIRVFCFGSSDLYFEKVPGLSRCAGLSNTEIKIRRLRAISFCGQIRLPPRREIDQIAAVLLKANIYKFLTAVVVI